MKVDSAAAVGPDQPLGAVREMIGQWKRRAGHLRRRPMIKLWLGMRRALGGADYLSEMLFWENALSRRPGWLSNREAWARAFPRELGEAVASLRANGEANGAPVKVLEVGSGPVSLLAHGVERGMISVVAVDPLARLYRMLLREHRIAYPVSPVAGSGERLVAQFAHARFKAVYSSNALDHTSSPRRCLREMCGVLRGGGRIVLEGFEREGSNEDWAGLHQHDLVPEEGELIRYDRAGRRENLTGGLGLQCVHQRVLPFRQRAIDGFGYEVPEETSPDAWKWNQCGWYTMVFRKVE